MLLSDMNLRIGKVKNYNNKILISSPSFKIGTNLKINLDGEQAKLVDKPDVKFKEVEMVKTKPDVKQNRNLTYFIYVLFYFFHSLFGNLTFCTTCRFIHIKTHILNEFLPKILKYALGTSHLLVGDRMSLYVPLSFSKAIL